MVMTNPDLEFTRLNKPKSNQPSQINIANFRNKKLNHDYHQKLDKEYNNKDATTNDDRWQRVVTTCLKVGEEILGNKDKKKTTDQDKEIKRLSDMRQNIKRQITDSVSSEKITTFKKERQYIKK